MNNFGQHRRRHHHENRLTPANQLNQLRYVPRALRLVWGAASGWALASTVLLVIQGLLPVLTVYLTRELVNALVVVIDSGGEPATLQPALLTIVLMGGVLNRGGSDAGGGAVEWTR